MRQAKRDHITTQADGLSAARQDVEERIERHLAVAELLIAILDQIDGDENLEPSLGHYPLGLPAEFVDCEMDGPPCSAGEA
jgi:hypothetical protein